MLKELVDKNRSHREFKGGVTIPRERLEAWIANANHCPAAMNLQTIKYRIYDSAKDVARILPITRWASSLGKKLPPEGHEPSAFILMMHDTTLAPIKPIFLMDVGICAQTIMLSATEDGFGGCMIGSATEETMRETLNIPEELTPVLLLGLGEPEDQVVLTVAEERVKYYRDENNVHYVPKRPLEEIII